MAKGGVRPESCAAGEACARVVVQVAGKKASSNEGEGLQLTSVLSVSGRHKRSPPITITPPLLFLSCSCWDQLNVLSAFTPPPPPRVDASALQIYFPSLDFPRFVRVRWQDEDASLLGNIGKVSVAQLKINK